MAAGLGSIMCSYNKICQIGGEMKQCAPGAIGNWSCANHDTLVTDLKGRLGFEGYVMSDWGATHSTSMNEGLDQEMPGAEFMGDKLASEPCVCCAAQQRRTQARTDAHAHTPLPRPCAWPLYRGRRAACGVRPVDTCCG